MARLFSLLLILLSGLAGSAATTPITLALAPFEAGRSVPEALPALAQTHLENALKTSGAFTLVERQQLTDVLTEAAFQQSGATLAQNAAALGQQLNAQKLLFGQIHRLKREYTFHLKVVDVTTNQIDYVEQLALNDQPSAIAVTMRHLANRLAAFSALWSPAPMVFFPADTFIMGSDNGPPDSQPTHRVQLQPFYMDPYEVSAIAYFAFQQAAGDTPPFPAQPNHPVTMVSWTEAFAYCRAQGKRLPTEAEWEYAAVGNDRRPYPWGYAAPQATRARFAGVEQGPVDITALPQGATPAGLYHLAGNVAEWVQDWWSPTYYQTSPAVAPSGPEQGDYKVVRGGSWDQPAFELSPSLRAYHNPDKGAAHIGFRCARSAPPDPLPKVPSP